MQKLVYSCTLIPAGNGGIYEDPSETHNECLQSCFVKNIRKEMVLRSIAHVAVRKRHQRQDEIIIFLPTLDWNQQSCLFLLVRMHFIQAYVVWNVCIYSKGTSVCCANWIELSAGGVLHDRAFLKTTFEWSAGKNNPDFVQLLMAFRYSNSYYTSCFLKESLKFYVEICRSIFYATWKLETYF